MEEEKKPMSKEGNKKAEFAVKILIQYAKENGISARNTTDLSPLEQWLIIQLFKTQNQ